MKYQLWGIGALIAVLVALWVLLSGWTIKDRPGEWQMVVHPIQQTGGGCVCLAPVGPEEACCFE